MAVLKHLVPGGMGQGNGDGVIWFPTRDISAESLIVGALEAAFWEMVKLYDFHVWIVIYHKLTALVFLILLIELKFKLLSTKCNSLVTF
jgi:hypothetical protein